MFIDFREEAGRGGEEHGEETETDRHEGLPFELTELGIKSVT